MQADLVDAFKRLVAEKDARIALLERIVEEKDTRLAERDERIAALGRRVRALARGGLTVEAPTGLAG